MKKSPFANQQHEGGMVNLGYRINFAQLYEVGEQLGKGGFGIVQKVKRKSTSEYFACKKIAKRLPTSLSSESQQQRHLENVQREVAVLKALKGSLNIVTFEDVLEDDEFVYLVMECCSGGELLHTIGLRPYLESTVVRIMRAVLLTLAQCHAKGILHRDIKPGNFMFLKEDPGAPIKAVDFGLAVFFEKDQLPRTDLGFDGTPWFMAPEVLSSDVVPASDVWSAGVMAYQLLSGLLPFDDKKCRHAPALSAVWKSVLSDQPDFSRKCWQQVSEEAKDFITILLNKNPKERPTAQEALSHVWLKKDQEQGAVPRGFSQTIVQRIQRFGQSSLFKRTVLDMIANELLQSYIEKTRYDAKKIISFHPNNEEECLSSHPLREGRSEHNQSKAIDIVKTRQDRRIWKSHADLTRLASSVSVEDWEDVKKASRLALDTSSHGSELYLSILGTVHASQEVEIEPTSQIVQASGLRTPSSPLLTKSPTAAAQALQSVFEKDVEVSEKSAQDEERFRGRSFYKDFVEAHGEVVSIEIDEDSEVTIPFKIDEKAVRVEQFMSTVFGVQNMEDINKIMDFLNIGVETNATEKELINGLSKLGYDVDENEICCLLEILSPGCEEVNFTQFVASQVDWDDVQENHKEKWLECVKHAFEAMDRDKDGRLSTDDLVASIADKLPEKEDIDAALDQAKVESCVADLNINFEDFLALLSDTSRSADSLFRFDSRYHTYVSSLHEGKEF